MEVRVLGPLEVVAGGVSIPIGGGRQRKLLAILLLQANEFVSSDRLIDDLWGDDRPETAGKALQGYVSQLRKTLGPDALVTGAGGYMLKLGPGQLDADRFEQLLDDARDAEPRDAAEWLREALALWRGPPLADFSYDDFAQGEIARFEERRLVALERRIEADLALGRHQEVIGELASLVKQHPLRERLRAELMLALYRSGRQAEALEAYADARRALLDELGLEPSEELRQLQAAILAHDPQLGPSPRTAWPRARRAISRPRFLAALGAALLLGAFGATALVILGDSGEPALARAEPDSVALLDPSTGELLGQVPVRRTMMLEFGGGFLWSMSADGTLDKIDPRSRSVVRRVGLGVHPGGLAFGDGSVWISDADSPTLLRIDPKYGSVERVELPARGGGAGRLAVGAGSVWAVQGGSRVVRIDPETNRLEHSWRLREAGEVHFAEGKAWLVSTGNGVMQRVDPATNLITGSVRLRPTACCSAAGGGFVWMMGGLDATVWKFSNLANPSSPLASVKLARPGGDIAYGNGALWATTGSAGTVTRVNPRTNATTTFAVGHEAGVIAVGNGLLAIGVRPTAADATAELRGRVAHFVSINDWLDDTDPAIATQPWQWQLEYATCAKLMNYPDAPAPAGWRVRPEVAAAPPQVSTDGRTYSFRIRRGFRFSPPSNEPVTAETFKATIERALSPRLGPSAVAAAFVSDMVGVAEYRAGRSEHISGIEVRGDTLKITLRRPAGDLPSRMALPYFCAVPVKTPIVANGLEDPIPAAGPYYLASHTGDVVAVVKRNPNYGGARPQRLDAIVFRRPNARNDDAVSEIERGTADHVGEFDGNGQPPLVANGRLAARYGSSRQDGEPRFLVSPLPAIEYLAFNMRGRLFSDARVRRAVNFAVDRRALQDTYGWPPADHYLPPAVPGYRDSHIYPLERPDLARARALARGHGGRALLHVCNYEYCRQWARIIRANLAEIGIRVVLRASPDPTARASAEGGDMLLTRASVAFPSSYQDPVIFLEKVLGLPRSRTPLRQAARSGWCPPCDVPRGWFAAGRFERELERIRHLGGREREAAAGALDLKLARAAPGAVLLSETYSELFSARMGCQKFQPLYYGVDIAALCLREDD
jgi:DNA-binding SARP family transcriptional activator/ABC-type transport system substrate-binding protein